MYVYKVASWVVSQEGQAEWCGQYTLAYWLSIYDK